MSDNWLQFVPSDPTFQPDRAAAQRAKSLLASFVPQAFEVNALFTDTVRFFDPGGNWSGVNCPKCGADIQDWWTEKMDAAFKGGFKELYVRTNCCGELVSLNEMDYVWPAAFGRFVLDAMNPNVCDLTPNQKQQLADCLGCELRTIRVHI